MKPARDMTDEELEALYEEAVNNTNRALEEMTA